MTMPLMPKAKRPRWISPPKPFEGRGMDNSAFYNSRAWRRFRAGYLMENPLCHECQKMKLVVPATVADHIIPIADGGERWDPANIQALCASHHNSKSGREGGKKRK